jgi:hypothetical protein
MVRYSPAPAAPPRAAPTFAAGAKLADIGHHAENNFVDFLVCSMRSVADLLRSRSVIGVGAEGALRALLLPLERRGLTLRVTRDGHG